MEPCSRTLADVPLTFVRVLELVFFLVVAAASAAALLSAAFVGSHARGEHGRGGPLSAPGESDVLRVHRARRRRS
jgi:hypothetical protein